MAKKDSSECAFESKGDNHCRECRCGTVAFTAQDWRPSDIALVLGPSSFANDALVQSLISELKDHINIVTDVSFDSFEEDMQTFFTKDRHGDMIVILKNPTVDFLMTEKCRKTILSGRQYHVGFWIIDQQQVYRDIPRWLKGDVNKVLMLQASNDDEIKMWCEDWIPFIPHSIACDSVEKCTSYHEIFIVDVDAEGKINPLRNYKPNYVPKNESPIHIIPLNGTTYRNYKGSPSFTEVVLFWPLILGMFLQFNLHMLGIFQPHIDVCSFYEFSQYSIYGCGVMYTLTHLLICFVSLVSANLLTSCRRWLERIHHASNQYLFP